MTTLEKIQDRLTKYPHLKYAVTGNTLTIDAPSPEGFSVSMTEAPAEWIVGFGDWHDHFDTEEEALEFFAFGLSEACRLAITLRGTFAYHWSVQTQTEDDWQTIRTTGLILFPFWRRKRVEYRQNAVIAAAP